MKRWIAGITLVLLLGSLTGCSSFGIDPEQQLRPPLVPGEQNEIQQALRDYISINAPQENYVLKYPKNGAYRSAFIIEDFDGDGQKEALAFYRIGTAGVPGDSIHINLLQQIDKKWKSVSDIEGASTDIDSVVLSDLDGDGLRELFIGWNMYDGTKRTLTLYAMNDFTLSEKLKKNYAGLLVGAITSDEHEDFIIFGPGRDGGTVASLCMYKDGVAYADVQVVPLPDVVQRFVSIQVVDIAPSVKGIYVDGVRESDMMATDLLLYTRETVDEEQRTSVENTALPAGRLSLQPFVSGSKSNLSLRSPHILSVDMDGDGSMEWPGCKLLRDMDETATAANREGTTRWWTTFYNWDYANKQITPQFSCLYNMADGYYLTVEADWENKLTTEYDKVQKQLDVYKVGLTGRKEGVLLSVRVEPLQTVTETANGGSAPAAASGKSDKEDRREFKTIAETSLVRYKIWYEEEEEFKLNAEDVSYRFVLLTKSGG